MTGGLHFCDIPLSSNRFREGRVWVCECGQVWMYLDGKWRMCAKS